MSSILSVDVIEPAADATVSIPTLDTRMCTAWVNFDGFTGIIRDSFNVSSITFNAAGNYSINYTVDMDNTNYSVVGMSDNIDIFINGLLQVSDVPIITYEWNLSVVASRSIVSIQIFGGKNL